MRKCIHERNSKIFKSRSRTLLKQVLKKEINDTMKDLRSIYNVLTDLRHNLSDKYLWGLNKDIKFVLDMNNKYKKWIEHLYTINVYIVRRYYERYSIWWVDWRAFESTI